MNKSLTCLIPLYGSQRFRSIVLMNIDEHLNAGMKVIVSDRHFKDNLIEEIETRYQDNPSVLTIQKNDEVDWVENINNMIEIVDTDYFRILPHDDSTDANSTQLLIDALENDTSAILATGIIFAGDLFGGRLPEKDELNIQDANLSSKWCIEDCLSFYWKGRFAGSFKGVVRSTPVQTLRLLIEKTPTLVHSERTWLFALTLIGKFIFVPQSILLKRYYATSTHRQWESSEKTTLDAASVMANYCERLLDDKCLVSKLKFNIFYNSLRQIRNQKNSNSYSNLIVD